MKCIIKNVELRGYEKKISSKGTEYGLLYFEDFNTGKSDNVLFKDMNICKSLSECRGKLADLNCILDVHSTYTKFELESIEYNG